jgi:hypothetical protein
VWLCCWPLCTRCRTRGRARAASDRHARSRGRAIQSGTRVRKTRVGVTAAATIRRSSCTRNRHRHFRHRRPRWPRHERSPARRHSARSTALLDGPRNTRTFGRPSLRSLTIPRSPVRMASCAARFFSRSACPHCCGRPTLVRRQSHRTTSSLCRVGPASSRATRTGPASRTGSGEPSSRRLPSSLNRSGSPRWCMRSSRPRPQRASSRRHEPPVRPILQSVQHRTTSATRHS